MVNTNSRIIPEMIRKAISDGWSETDAKRGYTVAVSDCKAEYIRRIDEMNAFESDDAAAQQAEKDGIKIIHDLVLPFSKRANYIDTPENRKLLEPIATEYKTKIIQYLLNQGTGIIYAPITEKSYTTEAELKAANSCNRKVRYVMSDVIDDFLHYEHPEQIEYTIENNLDLIDFDEWQAIQKVLFMNTANKNDTIPYKIAVKINAVLWTEDITPLELLPPVNKTEDTV